ncbi:MAG: serine protease [Candidatus Omnitrophica bacterium]|nr:serine protease [Candidatus Omnitrophota bacterium]
MIKKSVLVFLVFAVWGCLAKAQENGIGRKIFQTYRDSVVTVKFVLQERAVMKGREGGSIESKMQTNGTIVSKNGIIVCSLTTSDPSQILSQFMGANSNVSLKSKIISIKIRFPDGQEISADILLRDPGQDLLFLKPVKKMPSSITYVHLSDSANPEIFDNIFFISRLGKMANWAPLISAGRISGIIKEPRLSYIPESEEFANESFGDVLGNPVFASNGKIIGIILLSKGLSSSEGATMGSMLFNSTEALGTIPVIIPANDILKVEAQIKSVSTKK